MRLFVAVELPETVRRELAGCIEKLSSFGGDVRWVEPKNLHVTLKFLGSVEESRLLSIRNELEKIARRSKPFVARLTSLRGFPRASDPQIVWAGVGEGVENLSELAKLTEESLRDQGFQTEDRAFTAHVTLGRARSKKIWKKSHRPFKKICPSVVMRLR
ncbi:MAG: 2'-5' RNA ligase [Candidatus Omnitrophica bacterium CG1_02_46_14]|nr:MAG: 2'-5' RNA ligase [Candidatus Omnitrophica bacterium CG1_02_46_14]